MAAVGPGHKHRWKVDDSDRAHRSENGTLVYWQRCWCRTKAEVPAYPPEMFSFTPRSLGYTWSHLPEDE